ncbi:MAG: CvpA family protein [Proteobacteria bacterium]|nr:CvpA family protein [Pseudomonadota bacterium]MBU1716914.1 CvpA family protein [Pseudomonadota bacterium]
MTSIDTIFLIIILSFTARGIWIGFVRQIAFITALVLGFVAAGRFYEYFADLVLPFITIPQVAFFVTYILLFMVVYFFVMLVGVGLKKVINFSLLQGFDRLMGGAFGLAKGLFVANLVFVILAGSLSNSGPFLRKSWSYPFLKMSSGYIILFIKDRGLRSRFLPSEPAITSVFDLSSDLPAVSKKKIGSSHDLTLNELRYNLRKESGLTPKK